ncbi:MAG: ABC transporter ATP-binding protein [Chloroflexota bacterium]|nr:ABC transporter ATP-binding protein [Chloroflexota bacterium]
MKQERLLHKSLAILNAKQRKSALWLGFLMFTGMVLETLGVGLVIPVLGILTQADLADRYPVIVPLLEALGNPDHSTLVLGGMLLLATVFAIKSLFLAFLAWRSMRFVYRLQAELSLRLFNYYLLQPYTFHLQRNSAQLIRNTTTEVSQFATVLNSLFMLVSEGLVMIGLGALLVFVEPFGALCVIVILGGAGLAYHRLTRMSILSWGEERQFNEGMRIQHLQQGLGSVKDIKLLGREEGFVDRFSQHNLRNAHAWEKITALQQLPRLGLEFLAVLGLAVLVVAMVFQGRALDTLVPTLGVFAIAAFRLMPSVNRMLGGINALRFSTPVINTLHTELNSLSKDSPSLSKSPLLFTHELKLNGVTFTYPAAEKQALIDISLSIPKGNTIGIIGKSGAGKSTLVDVLLGLLAPKSGTVTVDGANIQAHMRSWQDQIGYVSQAIFLTDDSFRRNVALGIPDEKIDDKAIWRAIHAAQLAYLVEELPEGLSTMVGERGIRLSGGQRQRIGIARALYHDPPVLVLDEATSSLDMETEHGVMESVQALHGSKTIVIIAHRLSTIENCDNLYVLNEGKVVDTGTVEQILGDEFS